MKRAAPCDLEPNAESFDVLGASVDAPRASRILKPRLSTDMEPEHEAGEAHFSLPPGPECVDSMLAWPDRALRAMPDDFTRDLVKKVSAGVSFTEDYAGYGSGTTAAQHLATALSGLGFDIGNGFQCVRVSDVDPVCRLALRLHKGAVAPCCVMGDMMRRLPADIAKKLQDLSDWAQGAVKERVMSGENEAVAHRAVGDNLIEKACATLAGARQ